MSDQNSSTIFFFFFWSPFLLKSRSYSNWEKIPSKTCPSSTIKCPINSNSISWWDMSPNPSFPTSWWVQTNKQSLLISEIAVPLWRMFSLTSLLMSSPQATGLYVAFQDNSACDWPPCPAAKLVAVGGGFRCRHTESLWPCCVFHLPWSCSGTSWVPAGQMTSEIPCIISLYQEAVGWSVKPAGMVKGDRHILIWPVLGIQVSY